MPLNIVVKLLVTDADMLVTDATALFLINVHDAVVFALMEAHVVLNVVEISPNFVPIVVAMVFMPVVTARFNSTIAPALATIPAKMLSKIPTVPVFVSDSLSLAPCAKPSM